MLDLRIVISITISLLVGEFTGYLTGGMISAGYISLYMLNPLRILTTLLLSLVVFLIAKALAGVTILFGRRRFLLIIAASMLLGLLFNHFFLAALPFEQDARVIGIIVPGLIANDMYRQGVLKTCVALLFTSSLVFLFVALIT